MDNCYLLVAVKHHLVRITTVHVTWTSEPLSARLGELAGPSPPTPSSSAKEEEDSSFLSDLKHVVEYNNLCPLECRTLCKHFLPAKIDPDGDLLVALHSQFVLKICGTLMTFKELTITSVIRMSCLPPTAFLYRGLYSDPVTLITNFIAIINRHHRD